MDNSERFTIFCRECDDDKALIQDSDSGSYRCPDCDSIYYDEDGVFDAQEAQYYYETYRGAKRAGMIPENDYPESLNDGIW